MTASKNAYDIISPKLIQVTLVHTKYQFHSELDLLECSQQLTIHSNRRLEVSHRRSFVDQVGYFRSDVHGNVTIDEVVPCDLQYNHNLFLVLLEFCVVLLGFPHEVIFCGCKCEVYGLSEYLPSSFWHFSPVSIGSRNFRMSSLLIDMCMMRTVRGIYYRQCMQIIYTQILALPKTPSINPNK